MNPAVVCKPLIKFDMFTFIVFKPGSLRKSREIDTILTLVSTLLALSQFFTLDEPLIQGQRKYKCLLKIDR